MTNSDWQVANSLGGGAAAGPALSSFRSSFVSEADWQYMASQALNAVRIPIGYWLAEDPNPQDPFAPGTLAALDWAFTMASKYGVRVWFSLHVVYGSNSGSLGSRSGQCEFSIRNNAAKTVALAAFLAQRYAAHPMWLGMGLINEPLMDGQYGLARGISYDLLAWYYSEAYNAIRQASPCAFITMEGRVGNSPWEVNWLMLDTWHTNLGLEVHAYDVFYGFDGYTPQQELAYVSDGRVKDLLGFQKVMGRKGAPVLGLWVSRPQG